MVEWVAVAFRSEFPAGDNEVLKQKNTGGWLAGLTNQLFEESPQRGFDVASLNIQRGRDHGLPSYNEWRDLCGLGKLSSFDDINFSRKYSSVYE